MRKLLLAILGVLFLLSQPVFGSAGGKELLRQGPFPVRTQNPLYLLFISLRPDRPVTLPKGASEFRIDSSYSNLFEYRSSSATGNILNLDMELWRIGYVARYGLADNLEIGIEVPTIHSGGGFLDPLVEFYHTTFGFPNAGRELFDQNQFNYSVTAGGTTLYQAGSQGLGLSDIVLDAKYRLMDARRWIPTMAAQAMFKAPTGSRDEGLGSGTPDGGLFWLAEHGWKRLAGYVNAGWLFLGGAQPLESVSRNYSFSWMGGVEYSLASWISALAQVNGTTAIFHGLNFTQFDDGPLDLTIGFRGAYREWIWQAAFTEDPGANDASIDFTGFLSLGYRPRWRY